MFGGGQVHVASSLHSPTAAYLLLNSPLLSPDGSIIDQSEKQLTYRKDRLISAQNGQLRLNNLTDFRDNSALKLNMYSVTEDKGNSGLAVISIPSFQDGGREQSSPDTPLPGSSSQILHYRQKSGDAMLSAINYNEPNDILNEGPFDPLSNLDDGILSMGSGPMRLADNPYPELFDGEGNVNDSYSMGGLSPQPYDSGTFDGALPSVMDSDSIHNTGTCTIEFICFARAGGLNLLFDINTNEIEYKYM